MNDEPRPPSNRPSPIRIVMALGLFVILALLLTPPRCGRPGQCAAREANTKAMLKDLETALRAYAHDFGVFPPTQVGLGTSGVVKALRAIGPRGLPYCEFREQALSGGREPHLVSMLNKPVFYANASDPQGHILHRNDFDLWTEGCDAEEGVPPDGLNNWK